MRGELPSYTDPRDRKNGWPYTARVSASSYRTKAERRQYEKYLAEAREAAEEQDRKQPKINRLGSIDIAALALEVEMEDRASAGLDDTDTLRQEPVTEADLEAILPSAPHEIGAETVSEPAELADVVALNGVQLAHRAALDRRREQDEHFIEERRALVFG